jgi:hypothetical protein
MKVSDLISIDDALHVRIGPVTVSLTPRQGFDLAEDLVRKSLRRAMAEEVDHDAATRRAAPRKAGRQP